MDGRVPAEAMRNLPTSPPVLQTPFLKDLAQKLFTYQSTSSVVNKFIRDRAMKIIQLADNQIKALAPGPASLDAATKLITGMFSQLQKTAEADFKGLPPETSIDNCAFLCQFKKTFTIREFIDSLKAQEQALKSQLVQRLQASPKTLSTQARVGA